MERKDIDRNRINERFAFGDKHLALARKIVQSSKEEFIMNFELQVQGERVFEVLSQILLDVCTHVMAVIKKNNLPSTYSDCMISLGELGVFSIDESRKYAKLTRMRNFISHNYDVIDAEQVFSGLQQIIVDFPSFREKFFLWLDSLP